jgi:polysaccharide biosynthesis protein PslH
LGPIRILSIVWYKILPAQFGGQKGIANFNQALGKLYPLTCLCSADNVTGEDLSYKVLPELPIGKQQFFKAISYKKIIEVAKKEKPTHILLEHPYHGIAAAKAAKATGAKIIVHSHNIESERYRQLGKWWWRLLYRYEKKVHQRADLSLFKTEKELQYAITHFQLSPKKCIVLPYGVDRPEVKHKIPSANKILLFAGTLDYEPNAKAVENIYKEIAPRLEKDITIIICGRNKIPGFEYLNKLSHPSVINAGEVNDINSYFEKADLFINPVQTGGGVQTKNIDALSFDLNVVCFDNMLSGLDFKVCGDKVYPSNNWNDFNENINRALAAPKAPTPAAFFEYYSFDKQVTSLPLP